jgi:predicted nucleotidyltransferase component of viral defense system
MVDIGSLAKQYPPELAGFKRNMIAEYLQCKVLSCMYKNGAAGKLCFIGGTAIRLLHNSSRFSEDLDFDNLGMDKKGFEIMGRAARDYAAKEGYDCSVDFSFRGAYRCFLRFPGLYYKYGISGHEGEKLLIQIDAEEQGIKYPQEAGIINRFGVFARVGTPGAGTLLAMKIAALLGRKRAKGRDFYDVTYLAALAYPDFNYLKKKAQISGIKELMERLNGKVSSLDMEGVADDVAPFLFSRSDTDRVKFFDDFLKAWEKDLSRKNT